MEKSKSAHFKTGCPFWVRKQYNLYQNDYRQPTTSERCVVFLWFLEMEINHICIHFKEIHYFLLCSRKLKKLISECKYSFHVEIMCLADMDRWWWLSACQESVLVSKSICPFIGSDAISSWLKCVLVPERLSPPTYYCHSQFSVWKANQICWMINKLIISNFVLYGQSLISAHKYAFYVEMTCLAIMGRRR